MARGAAKIIMAVATDERYRSRFSRIEFRNYLCSVVYVTILTYTAFLSRTADDFRRLHMLLQPVAILEDRRQTGAVFRRRRSGRFGPCAHTACFAR